MKKTKRVKKMKILNKIQVELSARKDADNKFGGYKYRTAESILEAVKPFLRESSAVLTLTDDILMIGDRYYVKSTATLLDGELSVSVSAFARESLAQKGMVDPMLTGSSSSYARKYALNGLFAIDNAENDPDTKDNRNQGQPETFGVFCSKDEAVKIKALMLEVGADTNKFFAFFKVDSFSSIKSADVSKAMAMLNSKRIK